MNGFLVKLKDRMRDSAGAAIALVALSMVALLSAVALAVDVGMLVTARTEAQLLGDGAALFGARVLRDTNGDSAAAHLAAMTAGSTDNTVRGENVPVLEEDVDVILDEWTVRVRVHRTDTRGNPVPTFFARIFGVDAVNITAVAAAWAAPSTASGGDPTSACMLPLALIDDFNDIDGDGLFEPEAGETITGYDASDHGKLIKLKLRPSGPESGPSVCDTDPGDPDVEYNIDYCASAESSWRCWWRPDHPSDGGDGGVDALGPLIYPATSCEPEVRIRDTLWSASGSGNKQSLITDEFKQLINSDLSKAWCDDCASDGRGCIVDTAVDSTACYDGESLRRRSSPVVDPSIFGGGGANNQAEVTNFIGVFVEQVSCSYSAGQFGGPEGQWNVYVRLLVEGGHGNAGEGGESEASLLRTLQLIE